MSSPAPAAGPSRVGYSTTPFRQLDTLSYSRPPLSSSSRSSTPLYPNGARFRSGSVFSREQFKKEEISRKRQESRNRLRSTWDLLFEKYRDVEDDDEIDLVTGEVVKDRGRLRAVAGRDFGEISESDEDGEGSSALDGPEVFEFESDEDEIGDWDDRSGLDPQLPDSEDVEEEEEQRPAWTTDDQHDYEEFMRAEAMRKRDDSDEDDAEDLDRNLSFRTPSAPPSSDHEFDKHISPRSRGTRILPLPSLDDLFKSDGEDDEESSEDELAVIDNDSDGEILRFIPVAADTQRYWRAESESSYPRTKAIIEVVIPTRSRSIRPATSPPISLDSSSVRAPLRDLTYHSIMRPASSPSLADLFDTPPPASSSRLALASASLARSPSPRQQSPLQALPPGPSQSITSIQNVRISLEKLPALASSSKGKERMVGERPSEIVDESWGTPNSPYHKNLWRTRNGGVHSCKQCRAAGGEREGRAPWCRGRKGDCWFEPISQSSAEPAIITPTVNQLSMPDPVTSRKQKSPRHSKDGTISTRSRKERTCRPCREAGGERAEKATSCKGRKSWKICPFEWRDEESRSETEAEEVDDLRSIASDRNAPQLSAPQHPPPLPVLAKSTTSPIESDTDDVRIRRPARRKAPIIDSESDDLQSISESEMPARSPDAPSRPWGLPFRPFDLDAKLYLEDFSYATTGLPRRCKQCRIAGGDRLRRAWWCKGRVFAKDCSFTQGEQDVRVSSPENQRAPVVVVTNDGAATPQRTTVPETPVPTVTNKARVRRRRVMSTASNTTSPRPTSTTSFTHAMTAPPSPPPSSMPPSSPPASDVPDLRSISLCSSLPPSSPPVPYESQLRQTVHPTPSPSVSVAAATDDSPYPTPTGDKKIMRTIAPLRGITAVYRPTPPPSVDGARGSSISSEKEPLSLPRKSALRRPSDGTVPPSITLSVKRARFSLQPRSPPREASSDPLQADYESSEDELALGYDMDSSSPVRSFPSSSPAFARYASSSSPLRNEWTVRAADVGFKLGPEHTGRVPARMVQALASSLSTYRPTLGSSLFPNPSEAVSNYALPTPPPSFASTSSTGSIRELEGSGPASAADSAPTAIISAAGLMLPPPVPTQRLDTPRRPSTSTPEPSSSHSPVPIKFTSLPAAVVRAHARARSRSLSVAPYSTSAIEKDSRFRTPSNEGGFRRKGSREIMSTPSRKSRVMRSLARVAREVGDEAGLEWGLDEEADDGGRMWREGSVATYVG
ncbi:hypothetical protein CI109_105787 [Kwoniella shandongensis]|uniref:Uncharacterized protein n=1 Tax=Kwoniella shandongensis TaxID=1734106 RepID=A0A5M6C0U0_9TREE|nr:uncharacterized protein CI109_003126 [Kwoniella shandongensis]KAA5528594.1 hypothetical protein CI109_003126 [Kwoniella shandongensis]